MMVKHNTRIDRLRPSDRHDAAGDRERSRTCELTARLRYVRPRSERLTSSQRYKLVRAWLSAFVRCQKVQYKAGGTRVRRASIELSEKRRTQLSEARRTIVQGPTTLFRLNACISRRKRRKVPWVRRKRVGESHAFTTCFPTLHDARGVLAIPASLYDEAAQKVTLVAPS